MASFCTVAHIILGKVLTNLLPSLTGGVAIHPTRPYNYSLVVEGGPFIIVGPCYRGLAPPTILWPPLF